MQSAEPWDSPHNKTLLSKIPVVYQSPNGAEDSTKTNYVVPTGMRTMFPGAQGLKIADIRDGTPGTIMLLEVDNDRAIPWTAPMDLPIDPNNPNAGLGGLRSGGFLAALADGSVRMILSDINPAALNSLFDPADGSGRIDQLSH